jgi:hypothetical protein
VAAMLAEDLAGIKSRADPDRKRTPKLRGSNRLRQDGAKRGRPHSAFQPKAVFTTEQVVERLAALGGTIDELALWMSCSQPTVSSRFREFPALRAALERGKILSQISLRRSLFQRAMSRDASGVSAALFLGKMLLWREPDEGLLAKPSEEASPAAIAAAALARLPESDRETLERIMAKLTAPP